MSASKRRILGKAGRPTGPAEPGSRRRPGRAGHNAARGAWRAAGDSRRLARPSAGERRGTGPALRGSPEGEYRRGPEAEYRRGNCYVTAEALYHLLGGSAEGWQPMVMRWEGDTHWFLKRTGHGILGAMILDPLASTDLFKTRPDYSLARGCGFLTKQPSRRARLLMERMTWQSEV